MVDVRIESSGDIFISDPIYPTGGWKNILANPDGTLVYKDKTYRELFYESEVEDFKKPENGIIIRTDELEQNLSQILLRLGLNHFEKDEFLEYWIPNLKNLSSPYILFSIIEASEKEKIDHVIIDPEPTTRIEFIAYFKPLEEIVPIKKLELPETPKRVGFTEVEWGGTIDLGHNSN
jgi:hypothetical protein